MMSTKVILLVLGLSCSVCLVAEESENNATVDTTTAGTDTAVFAEPPVFSKPAPIIQAATVENMSTNLQGNTSNVTINAYYGDIGGELTLTCEAPYPIEWNITGLVAPPDVLQFMPRKSNWNETMWELELQIDFASATNFVGLSAVAEVACEDKGFWENRDQVRVFLRGPNNKTLIKGGDESNKWIISCLTTDPRHGAPKLYKAGIVNEDVTWDPLEGFRRRNGAAFPPGNYQCRKNHTNEALSFDVPEDTYYPRDNLTQIWRGDGMLEFRCGGEGQKRQIKMITQTSTDVEVKLVKDNETEMVRRLGLNNSGNGVVEGSLYCKDDGNRILHSWHFQFLPSPILIVDNIRGEANCHSGVQPTTLRSLKCHSVSDCQYWARQCLEQSFPAVARGCDRVLQRLFHSNKTRRCLVPGIDKPEECASLPFGHPSGIIECAVNGKPQLWTFFTALDHNIYTNYTAVPAGALVRVEEMNRKVVCTATAFLFASSLAFELKNVDGSSETHYPEPDTSAVVGLEVRATLEALSPEVVLVTCLAAMQSSTEIIRATIEVQSKLKPKPECKPQATAVEWRTVAEEVNTFYLGARDIKLNCTPSEIEQENEEADARWYFYKDGEKEQMLNDTLPYVQVESGYLHFLEVNDNLQGHYVCRTSVPGNFKGRIIRAFKILVMAEPMSTGMKVFYLILAGIVGFIFGVTICRIRKILAWIRPRLDGLFQRAIAYCR